MIDRSLLLDDLKRATKRLVEDLRTRTDEVPEVRDPVRSQYEEAREAGRTDRSFEEWREDLLAQVAVGWVLGTVFVRFCEDNELYEIPLISGAGNRLGLARDHRADWLAQHPAAGDREWLLEVFRRYRELPAVAEIFGDHNPLWQFGPTDDGAKALLEVWWGTNPDTGALRHNFTDPDLDTRFLGDLYQDLSDHAKENYALLQTPEFVESFILDRTLDPAIETFGLEEVRLIDPACGSGHFLLGAFDRLLSRWREREPATPIRDLVQRCLDAVHGVDLNPFAVAIGRFRLLAAALKRIEVRELADAPAFRINVAVGDALLHGRLGNQLFEGTVGLDQAVRHRYPTEDEDKANRILKSGHYHVVVGNPPYITVRDPGVRGVYRSVYISANRQYSLVAPFMERFFDLAMSHSQARPGGYIGAITANSFMKREFGKILVEEVLARRDLTHVVDTSGAHIPGHTTPTVILFARDQPPQSDTLRAILGIQGESGRLQRPSEGLVWRSITKFVDVGTMENEFVSAENAPRGRYRKHPWSLQGGAAPEVMEQIEERESCALRSVARLVGYTAQTNADAVFVRPRRSQRRRGIQSEWLRPWVVGEVIRDWSLGKVDYVIFPYDADAGRLRNVSEDGGVLRTMWPYRSLLWGRRTFNQRSYREEGRPWWEWHQVALDRIGNASLLFPNVATHNHVVLDREGHPTNSHAPFVKLPEDATEDDHLRLLGLLNSSTACFWMKQVFQKKTQMGGGGGAAEAPFTHQHEFDGTKLQQFPIPPEAPLRRARELDALAQELDQHLPARVLERQPPTREVLDAARGEVERIRRRMVALQEELDWECYHLYGLTEGSRTLPSESVPEIDRGHRAFEIALAQDMEADRTTSTWFERHGSTPVTEIPGAWPEEYRRLVEDRLELLRSDRKIALLERPEYKRRWNWVPWEGMEKEAVRDWLLARLEELDTWKEPELQTVARLADQLRQVPHAVEAAQIYAGHIDVDLTELVGSLVTEEAVPFAAPFRFRDSGLRKRREWERTWELQRIEDELDARAELPPDDPNHLSEAQAEAEKEAQGVKDIPVPPKYKKGDYARATYWQLRGKLDVPKERFLTYPGTRIGADDTEVVGWAGWDYLEQARALAGHYHRRKDEGGEEGELIPLLVGLEELVPWLLQWHNELHPTWGQRMGDFFRAFVDTEVRSLGRTPEDLRNWTPNGSRAAARV